MIALMDVGGPSLWGAAASPGRVILGSVRKLAMQESVSKTASNSHLQFPLEFYPSRPQRWTVIWKHKTNKTPFSLELLLVRVFLRGNRKEGRRAGQQERGRG